MTAALDVPVRADEFDLDGYLAQFDADALETSPDYRRAITRTDPLAFALVYLPHHLSGRETGEQITLSDFHLAIITDARAWMLPCDEPAEHRDVYVAPRGCGKSTWFFTCLPLWAAAHGWFGFVAAFANSGPQAELHLQTFKREIDVNALLRRDFPDLCTPAVRPSGTTVSDNRGMLVAQSGFVFAAKGIDATSLGMKVGTKRPDLIILDDIEPGEETYSAHQKGKRLGAVLDSVLPLNIYARVVLVGTVTMGGSIVHDAVRTITEPGDDPAEWMVEESFTCHYFPAIVTEDDGTERSVWPAKWSMTYLDSIRNTRSFQKNMMNSPMGANGDYWVPEDVRYGLPRLPLTHELLSIDPATTTKGTSDYTGLAVVGFSKPERVCVIRWARAVKVAPGTALRDMVLRTLEAFPNIRGVVIESNQGGDVWAGVLHGLPVPLQTVHQSEPKDVRAARFLSHYQQRRVLHEVRLPALEAQLVAYPKAPNDDLVDAAGTGVTVFLGKKKIIEIAKGRYA